MSEHNDLYTHINAIKAWLADYGGNVYHMPPFSSINLINTYAKNQLDLQKIQIQSVKQINNTKKK